MLFENEDGETLRRLDVSIPAWDRGDRPTAGGPLVAYWRTTMREKDTPQKALIGDDEVIDLFDQLEDAQSDDQLAFRYLLCLILIRKKMLVWEGATPATSGTRGLITVRRRKDKEGPFTEVVDPGLDDESIEAASKQLSAVMNLDGDQA